MIQPQWSAPKGVHAFSTTRDMRVNEQMGVSAAPFDGFNIATHVGDDAQAVQTNRALLREILPSEPLWLNQTHGIEVYQSSIVRKGIPEADAVLVTEPNQVAVIMTADCLPVLFTTTQGTMVAGAHAGWRSLVNGVLERTVHAMCDAGAQRGDIIAWMGPAIGPAHFEIGAEVREQFIECGIQLGLSASEMSASFAPQGQGKFMADIYALGKQRLRLAGITQITGGELCTVSDPQRFYSYRRDGVTGRMASLIWFE